MRCFLIPFAAVLLSITPFSVTAQQVNVGHPPTCQLFISGEFDGRGIVDLDGFLASLRQTRKCGLIVVILKSPRGDVVTALRV